MKAIITGASAGIGEALARRMARDGWDLVLVARRIDRLAALEAELERDHRVRVEVIGLDVTGPDAPGRLLEAAGDADVLVNNAGYGKHGAQIDISPADSAGMVRLNCESLTALVATFLPRFVARGSGTILNVASVASFQPIPFFAVYSATKAYVLSLSIALDAEVKRHGVRVLALCPGPVPTEFQAIANTTDDHAPEILKATAEQVAEDALWMIHRGKGIWVPNFVLRFLIGLEAFVPNRLIVYLAGKSVPPPAPRPAPAPAPVSAVAPVLEKPIPDGSPPG
ncbi:MAG: SDR family NAD(P)-dependent oxidoreductase [Planctomycetota bacterium]